MVANEGLEKWKNVPHNSHLNREAIMLKNYAGIIYQGLPGIDGLISL